MKFKAIFLASFLVLVAHTNFVLASSSFKITTYNIRNFSQVDHEESPFKPLDGPTNSKILGKIIGDMKSDIMAFQEVINGPLLERQLAKLLPNHRVIMTECGGTADQKIVLAYDQRKFKLEKSEEEWRVSLSTRCNYGLRPALVAWLQHKSTGKHIAVVVVHLKAGAGDRNLATRRDQHQVLTQVLGDLSKQKLDDVIVVGDFNTTSYFEQDSGAAQFETFLKENDLRNTSANISCTSYWQSDRNDDLMSPSHLDHILHTGDFAAINPHSGAHCAQTACRPTPESELGDSFTGVSDHCPVQVEFKLSR